MILPMGATPQLSIFGKFRRETTLQLSYLSTVSRDITEMYSAIEKYMIN